MGLEERSERKRRCCVPYAARQDARRRRTCIQKSKMPMLLRRTSHFTDRSACSSVIKCSTLSTYIQPIPPAPSGYRQCSAKTQYMTTLKPAPSCTAEASEEVEKSSPARPILVVSFPTCLGGKQPRFRTASHFAHCRRLRYPSPEYAPQNSESHAQSGSAHPQSCPWR